MSKTSGKDMSVQRTISLPLTLFSRVNDEAEIMGKGFSDTTQVLLRIGLSVRESARIAEEKEMKDHLQKMKEAKIQ